MPMMLSLKHPKCYHLLDYKKGIWHVKTCCNYPKVIFSGYCPDEKKVVNERLKVAAVSSIVYIYHDHDF